MLELDKILISIRELTILSIILRYAACVVFGGIIGYERGKKCHPAGLRTHLLVCIGSASVMMVNQYIVENMNSLADPARLGAQVISGIGFLGVGTIVVTRQNQVKGLTTAAGLWASACMGLAIGIGFFEGAFIMCIFMYLVLEVLNRLDNSYLKNSDTKQLYVEYSKGISFVTIINELHNNNWKITHIDQLEAGSDYFISLLITISYSGKNLHNVDISDKIRVLENVICVETI